MAEQPYTPYYFRADPLIESTARPRAANDGSWRPPRAFGANRVSLSLLADQAFYFDGNTTQPQPVTIPPHILGRVYQTYSIYVGDRAEIWTVNYDASQQQVYNGSDDGMERQPPPDARPDWQELTFAQQPNDHDRVSAAGFMQRYHQLRLWLEDQQWVRQIIPAPYRPNNVRPRSSRRDSPQGGLIGDIALLLGLLALSIPQQVVTRYLPRLVNRRLSCLPITPQSHGDSARLSRRGVRVQVWANYPRPPSLQALAMNPGLRQQYVEAMLYANQLLRNIEAGRHGALFP